MAYGDIDSGTQMAGGIGQGLSAFADTYLRAKQMNMQNQTAQAGLLNAGYQQDDDGNLTPTEEKQNEMNVKKSQTQYQLNSMNPEHQVSKEARDQYTKLLKEYQPGSEGLIGPNMSKYEIENEVLPKLKMINDMSLDAKLKGLTIDKTKGDIAKTNKELGTPNEPQAKAGGLYTTAASAAQALDNLEKQNSFDPAAASAGFQGLIGSKYAQTKEYKEHEAAKEAFDSAYQQDLGARGLQPEKQEQIDKRFHVQPGDIDPSTGKTDPVIAQMKKQQRDNFIQSLKLRGGNMAAEPKQPGLLSNGKKKNMSVYDSDVMSYAKAHGISNQAAQMIKMKRTASSTASQTAPQQGDGG